MLFTKEVNRQLTQLAYKISCYPWEAVPKAGRELVSWHRRLLLTKEKIIPQLDADMLIFNHKGKYYKIKWAYNNVPTQQEWERKPDNFHLVIDLRFSPAIPELAVAIFDFNIPCAASRHLIDAAYS